MANPKRNQYYAVMDEDRKRVIAIMAAILIIEPTMKPARGVMTVFMRVGSTTLHVL
jgi:hypothetical protein